METPKIKKIREAKIIEKEKIEEIIKETLESPCILCKNMRNLTISELELLAEYAKENNIFICIKAEHSNFHNGTLIQLIKRDKLHIFIDYM